MTTHRPPTPTDRGTRTLKEAGKAVLAVAAVVLLLSPGGAGIIVAPVLLPLSWYLARRGGVVWRAVFTVLAAATGATVVWAATYVTVGEPGAAIVVLPVAAALAITGLVVRHA